MVGRWVCTPRVAAAHHGTDKSKRYGDRRVASECRFSSGERTRTTGRNPPVLPGSNQTSEGKAPGLLGLAQKGRQPPLPVGRKGRLSQSRQPSGGEEPPCLNTGARPARRGPP
ncbi:UNVERIFIED_CONTAM: hypothetical protein FKN15_035227 [Acipenser sinensis]